ILAQIGDRDRVALARQRQRARAAYAASAAADDGDPAFEPCGSGLRHVSLARLALSPPPASVRRQPGLAKSPPCGPRWAKQAPGVGLEPTTVTLTGSRSAFELPRIA